MILNKTINVNTYNLDASNKALIKTCKAKPMQLRITLLKHISIVIIVNLVIVFNMLQKYFGNKLEFILDSYLFLYLWN